MTYTYGSAAAHVAVDPGTEVLIFFLRRRDREQRYDIGETGRRSYGRSTTLIVSNRSRSAAARHQRKSWAWHRCESEPYRGLMRISDEPLRNAMAQIDR